MFAVNWALAGGDGEHRANGPPERSYGVGGEDLTASLGWNLPAPASRLERRHIRDRPGGGVSAAQRRSPLAWTV